MPAVDARDDPDAALIAWLDHEEAMFRRLERRVVSARISAGFGTGDQVDVDGFLKFSISVQNRRKSRMGYSMEHHLDAVFRALDLVFERQVVTEHGNTADFLFPGAAAYHDADYPEERLTMLASKSSLKDRWRQVLPEANRIWPKHLATLEPSISLAQTDQMQAERVQLVIPRPIHETFQDEQRDWLMTISDFATLVRDRQR